MLLILYYIHILSLMLRFYSYHTDCKDTSSYNRNIIYHALTLYGYIIMLFYGLYYINTISYYYIILILLYYIHIYNTINS